MEKQDNLDIMRFNMERNARTQSSSLLGAAAMSGDLVAPLPKRRGFTLIELMITVAIIGILAAIALPSYNSYIQRSRRVDTQAALLELAQAIERNFTLNNSYCTSGTGASCVITLDSVVKARVAAYYTILDPSAAAGTASSTTYTLQATPTAIQSADSCGTISLTSTGSRTATKSGTSVAGCWN